MNKTLNLIKFFYRNFFPSFIRKRLYKWELRFINWYNPLSKNLISDLANDDCFEACKKEILNKNYTIVNSILLETSKRPGIKIDWRIYTKDVNNPLIRDLIIEGLSLARTQKEEFYSILNSNNGDINSLFKTLEEFSNK